MKSLFIQLLDDLNLKKKYAYDWFCGPGSQ